MVVIRDLKILPTRFSSAVVPLPEKEEEKAENEETCFGITLKLSKIVHRVSTMLCMTSDVL